MGADLITYTFVGPKEIKLTPARTDILVKKLESAINAKIDKADKALAEIHVTSVDILCGDKRYRYWLEEYLDEEEDGQSVIVGMDTAAIRELIGEFVEFWNDPPFRDTTFRYFGTGKDIRKIVIAGEMSWGDEPDGEGFQLMKKASLCGLIELLDIE